MKPLRRKRPSGFAVSEVTGLEDISFTTEFNDATFNGLNGTYLLSDMTPEDIVRFKEAGIILPLVGGKDACHRVLVRLYRQAASGKQRNGKKHVHPQLCTGQQPKNKEGQPVAYTINVHKRSSTFRYNRATYGRKSLPSTPLK